MAKKQKRWLVAIGDPVVGYRVYPGTKPRRSKQGKWRLSGSWDSLDTYEIEQLVPSDRRPKPGGGPVLLGEW